MHTFSSTPQLNLGDGVYPGPARRNRSHTRVHPQPFAARDKHRLSSSMLRLPNNASRCHRRRPQPLESDGWVDNVPCVQPCGSAPGCSPGAGDRTLRAWNYERPRPAAAPAPTSAPIGQFMHQTPGKVTAEVNATNSKRPSPRSTSMALTLKPALRRAASAIRRSSALA
jgi:hypothetical protein